MASSAWQRLLGKADLVPPQTARQACKQDAPLDWLVCNGFTREQVLGTFSRLLKIPNTTFEKNRIDVRGIVKAGSLDYWQHFGAAPIESQNERIPIATAEPLNVVALDEFATILGRPIQPVLALREDIRHQLSTVGPRHLPPEIRKCPECEQELVEIVYGLPSPEPDAETESEPICHGGCIGLRHKPRVPGMRPDLLDRVTAASRP